jgi:hypothetical protein
MAIDWDAIRRRGKEGLLTARETDALVEMARPMSKPRFAGISNGVVRWGCWFCDAISGLDGKPHVDCPIAVLEAVRDE